MSPILALFIPGAVLLLLGFGLMRLGAWMQRKAAEIQAREPEPEVVEAEIVDLALSSTVFMAPERRRVVQPRPLALPPARGR